MRGNGFTRQILDRAGFIVSEARQPIGGEVKDRKTGADGESAAFDEEGAHNRKADAG